MVLAGLLKATCEAGKSMRPQAEGDIRSAAKPGAAA
jgi:hypothetical protein